MIEQIRELLDKYAAWLRDNTVLREINSNWVEITTPHLDRHNDYLQIYCRIENDGKITLSDGGYILEDLKISGCEIKSPKRKELLQMTLRGFGVGLDVSNNALTVAANDNNFPLMKHNIVQAMLAVNDLFFLSQPHISSIFLEDVTTWLDFNEIRYTPIVKFTGKTGYDHLFDFVIPKSKVKPERILKAINRPSPDQAKSLVFSWMDTREVRPRDSMAYAILNDSEQAIDYSVIEALKRYDINPVPWSEREKSKEQLAA